VQFTPQHGDHRGLIERPTKISMPNAEVYNSTFLRWHHSLIANDAGKTRWASEALKLLSIRHGKGQHAALLFLRSFNCGEGELLTSEGCLLSASAVDLTPHVPAAETSAYPAPIDREVS